MLDEEKYIETNWPKTIKLAKIQNQNLTYWNLIKKSKELHLFFLMVTGNYMIFNQEFQKTKTTNNFSQKDTQFVSENINGASYKKQTVLVKKTNGLI